MSVEATDAGRLPEPQEMTDAQRDRWTAVVTTLVALATKSGAGFTVSGAHASAVADRVGDALRQAGREHARTPVSSHDLSVYVNSRHHSDDGGGSNSSNRRGGSGGSSDRSTVGSSSSDRSTVGASRDRADIVIDLSDVTWPVIRRIAARLPAPDGWYVAECRAFFAGRAATWDTKFGDDMPAYAAAVAQAAPAPGSTVLDLGCGTGRALPALREAVGPEGTVVAADLTPQMLETARAAGRAERNTLLVADAHRLPFTDARIDTIFAAGLINHLHDLRGGLRELARVTRTGGQLVVFHPTGRASLAARHGRTLRPDEPLSEQELPRHLAATGWRQTSYDDAPHRFLAIAVRE